MFFPKTTSVLLTASALLIGSPASANEEPKTFNDQLTHLVNTNCSAAQDISKEDYIECFYQNTGFAMGSISRNCSIELDLSIAECIHHYRTLLKVPIMATNPGVVLGLSYHGLIDFMASLLYLRIKSELDQN